MSIRLEIINDLANTLGAISSTGGEAANAVAVLNTDQPILLEGGAELKTAANSVIFTESAGPEGSSVARIVIDDHGSGYTKPPEVTIQSAGMVNGNAYPVVSSSGVIERSVVDVRGGIYEDVANLLGAMGRPLLTQEGQNIRVPRVEYPKEILNPPITPYEDLETEGQSKVFTEQGVNIRVPGEEIIQNIIVGQLRNLQTEEHVNVLTEMGFNVQFLDRSPLITEGPYIILNARVEGDGTGARVRGLANLLGQLVGVQILSGGSGYNPENTSYVIECPTLEIPPAKAQAFVSGGRVTHIDVTFPSWGYTMVPRVTISSEGIGYNSDVAKAFPYRIPFYEISDKPTVCVFPVEETRLLYIAEEIFDSLEIEAIIYSRGNYNAHDLLLEDVEVVIDKFKSISPLPIIECKIMSYVDSSDLFFDEDLIVTSVGIKVEYLNGV